ncbi:MAG: hypothetical protein A2X64_05715 [Ignavibacteria bacterium GWF2_33_9]|nr:MAG: hypothetical protein A2X64_05715 [Ignavibacteria bacterium GWF2_33_9]
MNKLSQKIQDWLDSFPEFEQDDTLNIPEEKYTEAAKLFIEKMSNNYPFQHPLYAGQMLKPPHQVALEAYSAAMLINPNNHALDGGPATAEMEKELIREYADLFGFEEPLGHLTTSGTIANFEALLIARETHPGKAIAFSNQAHYTHSRVCGWLKIDTFAIESDQFGRMDLQDLELHLQTGKIGTVVVTLATTSLGALDDLQGILELQKKYNFRIHVDAAYGGYFKLIASNNPALSGFNLIQFADSITFDPHKQGLQPYGCGCIIFADASVGRFYKHDSPYTYFTSNELHLGEISVECSRAGAAAAALWFTHQIFPLKPSEGFGLIIQKTIDAANLFAQKIKQSSKYSLYLAPETNIVTYFPRAGNTSEISKKSEKIMLDLMNANKLWIATLKVDSTQFAKNHPEVKVNSAATTILRSCIMKPEQFDWIEKIIEILGNYE